jgi:regulation of enolase protein 1 (concanavalin A-like superfamily)
LFAFALAGPVFGAGEDAWASSDFGQPAQPGVTIVSGGVRTLQGCGSVWGAADQGHFHWQPIDGDFTLVARVGGIVRVGGGTPNNSAKAGLMLRANLDANSPEIMVFLSAAYGVQLQRRDSAGGATSTVASSGGSAPEWLKLSRAGRAVQAHRSEDGATWNLVGSATLDLPSRAYAGLVAASNTTSDSIRADFSFVSLTTASPLATGSGLTAEYFAAAAPFGAPTLVRGGEAIDFIWPGSPAPALLPADNFSVRWTGRVSPRRSGPIRFHTRSDDGVRLWIDGTLVIDNWTPHALTENTSADLVLDANTRHDIRLEFYDAGGGAQIELLWSGPNQPREIVPVERLYPEYPARGRILREVWSGITGNTIPALTGQSTFPARPSSRSFLTDFVSATDYADHYGAIVRGYIHPPVTGDYRFRIAGDDHVELWLSPDAQPANLTRIAYHNGWTPPLNWAKYADQESAPVPLHAGRKYYIEARHKEAAGGDNLAVGWTLPSGLAENPIPGHRLSPFEPVAVAPAPAAVLDHAARGHPRLLTDAEAWKRLRDRVSVTGSLSATWFARIKTQADGLLTTSVRGRTPDSERGTVFLNSARAVLERVTTLACAWQVTGNAAYLNRAALELRNVAGQSVTNPDGSTTAGWSDWNHAAHWLDTAELSLAVALGYDWLHAGLSASDRALLEDALANRALAPGLSALGADGATPQWWAASDSNWNLVCNGGLVAAALATDSAAATAAQLLPLALDSLEFGVSAFVPDGGHPEAPAYWTYSARYLAFALASLETAGGGAFGLGDTRGFAPLAAFPLAYTGPLSTAANYNDSAPSLYIEAASMYFSGRYNLPPAAAWHRARRGANGDVFDLLWLDPRGAAPSSSALPLDRWTRGTDLVTLRSAWDDSNALYVAVRGGDNREGHAQLQRGSFVLDAGGRRWISLLGYDSYGLPGYFSTNLAAYPNRWSYYRCRAEGANTLVIRPAGQAPSLAPDQDPQKAARVIDFRSAAAESSTTLDLSELYPAANSVRRQVSLLKPLNSSPTVLVSDVVRAALPVDIAWTVHTQASVALQNGNTEALLSLGGKQLRARVVAPSGATFEAEAATPPSAPAGQNPNTGFTRLRLRINGATNTTIKVEFNPLP